MNVTPPFFTPQSRFGDQRREIKNASVSFYKMGGLLERVEIANNERFSLVGMVPPSRLQNTRCVVLKSGATKPLECMQVPTLSFQGCTRA